MGKDRNGNPKYDIWSSSLEEVDKILKEALAATAKSKQHDKEAGKKQSTLEKTSKATAKSKQHDEEAGKKQSTLEKTSK
ncbi:Netrin receptor DCC, partial [Frankliniella fusca]